VKAETLLAFDNKVRGPLSRVLSYWKFIEVYSRARSFFLDILASSRPNVIAPRNPVKVDGVYYRNDLGNAAGFDKDGNLLPFSYFAGAGFGVVGTVLSEPNPGYKIKSFGKAVNPWMPLHYSESAMNTLSLPSKGVDEVLINVNEFRQRYQPKDFPIVFSIMEHPKYRNMPKLSRKSIISCVGKSLKEADVIEVNVSCPNAGHKDELRFIKGNLEDVVSIRDNSSTEKFVPIYVKVKGFGDNPEFTIDFFGKIGVNGICGVNSQTAYWQFLKDIDKREGGLYTYYTSRYKGGLTGKAIQRFAYSGMTSASKYVGERNINLVHVGGLGRHEDIVESRNIKEVKLRQRYTRMFSSMAKLGFEHFYKNMVLGD
jgi:dihydroorotate dehydrogenase